MKFQMLKFRMFLGMVVAGLLCTSLASAKEDANAADLKRMQGDWMAATMKVSGEEMPPDVAQALSARSKEIATACRAIAN